MVRSGKEIRGWSLTASAFLLLFAPAAASAATITVNGTGDLIAADAECTLREAITSANEAGMGVSGECVDGVPGADTINFSIPGDTSHTIAVSSELPPVTDELTISGRTDLDPSAPADEIVIDGGDAVANGLKIEADNSIVTGLTLVNFTFIGIDISDTDAVRIGGGSPLATNHIGTDAAGTTGLGGSRGIRVGAGAQPGTNAIIRNNVIADFTINGVEVNSPGSTGNVIAGNLIGTDPSGTVAMGGNEGILIGGGADANTIGGEMAAAGNLISGNDEGIEVLQSGSGDPAVGNLISSNKIGTTLDGEAALPNIRGVRIVGDVDATALAGNLISGNTGHQVILEGLSGADGPTDNEISGNTIGPDDDGTDDITDGDLVSIGGGTTGMSPVVGTLLGGADGLTIGGPCSGDCNLISGGGAALSGSGVLIGGDTEDTRILGNYIGTDRGGDAAIRNEDNGIQVNADDGGVIGSPEAPNLISGNGEDGVGVFTNGFGATIQSNLIGTTADGTALLGNGQYGIDIGMGSAVVGGTVEGEGNTIIDSAQSGIRLHSTAANTPILGNRIVDNGLSLGRLGIDIVPSGETGHIPTPNDGLGDEDDGPNGVQNFPTLGAAMIGASTRVTGVLDSTESTQFRIELFSTPPAQADPLNHGEAAILLGAFNVTTDATGRALFAETLGATAGSGDVITATATELDGSGTPVASSELAENVVEGCEQTGNGTGDVMAADATGQAICALGGDDMLGSGAGSDILDGGAGNDTAGYSTSVVPIAIDLVAQQAAAPDAIDMLASIESATGSSLDDMLVGDGEANSLDGGEGDDTISGGQGADSFTAGDGDDVINADDGESDDLIDCGGGTDVVNADAPTVDLDSVYVGCETINRPAGDPGPGPDPAPEPEPEPEPEPDEVICKGKVATVVGTETGETIKGTSGADVIAALGGADTIKGKGGSDTICAGKGADTVEGGSGHDTIKGEDGDDVLKGSKGDDAVQGNNGHDTLKGQGGKDTLKGGDGKDRLEGGDGKDTLDGGKGKKDKLKGGDGNDKLKGGKGGKDVCDGEKGKDELKGSKPGCETKKSL